MTDSLHSHIADVALGPIMEWQYDYEELQRDLAENVTDALLADPTLAAIIDLAAWYIEPSPMPPSWSPEVRALLATWRAER